MLVIFKVKEDNQKTNALFFDHCEPYCIFMLCQFSSPGSRQDRAQNFYRSITPMEKENKRKHNYAERVLVSLHRHDEVSASLSWSSRAELPIRLQNWPGLYGTTSFSH